MAVVRRWREEVRGEGRSHRKAVTEINRRDPNEKPKRKREEIHH